MKNSILLLGTLITFIVGSTLLVSCGSDKHHAEDSTEQELGTSQDENLAATYACSMHPEITGKDGDKCSKCNMNLTLAEASEEVEEQEQ